MKYERTIALLSV